MTKRIFRTALPALLLVVSHGCASTARLPNPLATPEQLDAEILAEKIVQEEAVRDAREYLHATWRTNASIFEPGGATVSDEQLALLGNAVDEAVYGAAIAAQTSDPNHPRLLITVAPPHTWFGRAVPGSRFAFDNPDTVYWQVSVDSGSKYVIHGRRNRQSPVTENVSLLDAVTQRTTANIAGEDLVTNADGSFAVTLDGDPANGRRNHLQVSAPSLVLVRNTASDWANQTYDMLTIERLEGPTPAPPPRTYQELVKATAALVRSRWAVVKQYGQYASAQPVNTLPAVGAANPVAVFRQLGYGYCLLAYNSRNWVGDGCFEPAGGAAAASLLALMGLALVYASRYPVFSSFRGIRVRTRPRHADRRRSTVLAKG